MQINKKLLILFKKERQVITKLHFSCSSATFASFIIAIIFYE